MGSHVSHRHTDQVILLGPWFMHQPLSFSLCCEEEYHNPLGSHTGIKELQRRQAPSPLHPCVTYLQVYIGTVDGHAMDRQLWMRCLWRNECLDCHQIDGTDISHGVFIPTQVQKGLEPHQLKEKLWNSEWPQLSAAPGTRVEELSLNEDNLRK